MSVRSLIDDLCSDACAGRQAGTPGGALARRHVVDAMREARLDPCEQAVPKANGANVLAYVPGEIERTVLVAAHYDHLGRAGKSIFRGADDNAAAVAILVEVGRRLAAQRPRGRGVLLAAFDAEEPPHFLTGSMGSEHFARHPTTPLDRIDLMICMELVGHAVGAPEHPRAVRDTTFVLGAERCAGLGTLVEGIATSEPGFVARRADAQVIPPLSDYAPFWERRRPFVLLTNGRTRHYHTPTDTVEQLDFGRIDATIRWLERLVREACARPEAPFAFEERTDDVSTLESLIAVLGALAERSDVAAMGHAEASRLRRLVDARGTLPKSERAARDRLVTALEAGLA